MFPRKEGPAGSKLQSHIGHSSNTSPACLRHVFAWMCGILVSCVSPIFCAACDIVSKRLLTFWITCFLLTLLLALVEWEFSWKDEVLFTLVIEWLWRRKGMGQKQGRLIVVTLMLTKQLVCKSGENCRLKSVQNKCLGRITGGCGDVYKLKAEPLESGLI